MLESFDSQLMVLFTEVMSKMSHRFHDDYNNHQTLAMPGHCIAAGCNSTSGMGYCLYSFPKDES